MNDDDIIDVFLRSFEKIDHVENLVELFWMRDDIDSEKKDREKIVKIMCKLLIMKCFEYSMNSLREKIEYTRRCA